MKVEVNLEKLQPWLNEKKVRLFCVCFAAPPSKSKDKIMIRIENQRFLTLSEVEKEIGEPIFTIHD